MAKKLFEEVEQKTALISVWDKTPAVAEMARILYDANWRIVGSEGTKKFLEKAVGIKVIETSEFTNVKPVLGHRVVTLAPQLHGGLLAEKHQLEELARLGWPQIDLVAITFYPLIDVMRNPAKGASDINEATDIGGPALVRSACKGGRIVLTHEGHFIRIAQEIASEETLDPKCVEWLQAVAAATVAQYQSSEALFRTLKLGPF